MRPNRPTLACDLQAIQIVNEKPFAEQKQRDSKTVTATSEPNAREVEEILGLVTPWLQTFAAHLIYAGSWGFLNAFGAYYYYYLRNLTPSVEAVSWIGITQATFVVIVGVLSGPIFDRGYLRELLIAGCFLTVFGTMVLSLATEYYQVFLAQAVCVGLGGGIIYIPSLAMVAASFKNPRHRALALATATSGAGVGGVVYPVLILKLIPQIGFAWATRVLGFLTLGCFLMALAIIIPRCRGTLTAARKRKEQEQHQHKSLIELSAMREPTFAVFSASLFLIFLAYWAPLYQIPTFAGSRLHQSEAQSIYALVIANGLTIPTRLIGALLAPALGAPAILVGSVLASAVLLFAWLGVHSEAGFIVWTVWFGLAVGPITVLIPAILPSLSPPHLIGGRMGLAWGAAALGSLLGVPLSAALNNVATGDFRGSILLQAVSMALGAASMAYVAVKLR